MKPLYIPIRLSHILRYNTVGAIIRGPKYLITPKDTREWTDRYGQVAARLIPYVDQVRSALGIEQELREPPIAQEREKGKIEGTCIPAIRFPSWMRCRICGLLYCQPWRHQPGETLLCTQCEKHPKLEQVAWIFVHPDGHMADIPWHRFTHDAANQNKNQCKSDWNFPYLRLIERQGSKYELVCERCHAKAKFSTGEQKFYGKLRRQPWLAWGDDINFAKSGPENKPAQVLTINDTRVHTPCGTSALVIPPESRIQRGSLVDRLYTNSQRRKEIDQQMNSLQKKSLLMRLADEFRCTPEDVDKAIWKIKSGYPSFGQQFTPGLLLKKEYEALTGQIPDLFDDEDFVTQHHTEAFKALTLEKGSIPQKIVDVIAQVTAVTRLKEIQILKGFRRVDPYEGTLVPPDIVGQEGWLPALELYGDGIFFTFEEKLLTHWESLQEVDSRARPLQERFKRSGIRFDPAVEISPRFILLHTFAHLLIRQLESQAGYPAASLKERIFSKPGKTPMGGILVYVAVPDVEGTLGGLSELAKPTSFLRLMSAVFDHAMWCSLDPICSEHEGQGPGLLNRSACHACTLIPEPACAHSNTLLDRGLITGSLSGQAKTLPAFLHTRIP